MSTTANDRSTVEAAREKAPEGQRVAVVTGAARGIGEAIARRLGRDGLHVIVADLPSMQEGVASTVEAITSAGGTATAAETDVTEEASVQALVETAVEAGGHLDVFVATPGSRRSRSSSTTTPQISRRSSTSTSPGSSTPTARPRGR